MNETLQWWAGPQGDAYLLRNRVDWAARIPFWREVFEQTDVRIAMELGANEGWNLLAYKAAIGRATMLTGWDVNRAATEAAAVNGVNVHFADPEMPLLPVDQARAYHGYDAFQMTFTAGCLIHVPPRDLERTMRGLISLSRRYVLAIEYDAPEEQEIEYRGEQGLLWRRPYGQLYQDLGLVLVRTWSPADVVGFDSCRAWLMEKR